MLNVIVTAVPELLAETKLKVPESHVAMVASVAFTNEQELREQVESSDSVMKFDIENPVKAFEFPKLVLYRSTS